MVKVATFPLDQEVTAEVLAAALQLPPPRLVAEQNASGRKMRIQVWDSVGLGIVVRWDRTQIVSWAMGKRPNRAPWTGIEFANHNHIPKVRS